MKTEKVPRPSVLYAKELFGEQPIRVLEIGVSQGLNAFSMLQTLNIQELYLIDPYIGNEKKQELDIMRRNLKDYQHKIKELLITSKSSLEVLEEAKFDFIYVDGDHSYEGCYFDIEEYSKLLAPNGILAGHDLDCSDVAQAAINYAIQNQKNIKILFPDYVIF